jgi:radical SAM/Cys-rich protein
MSADVAARCAALMQAHAFAVVDLTGGAPELCPEFRGLVRAARASGARVIVRHNLTVMFEPGQDDLPEFFAAHDVEVVSSLPHYLAATTDRQRGQGVFERSLAAIRRLNAVGYGAGRAGRVLTLVYNPAGAFLPGPQADLAADFHRELAARHGVRFDALVALTNMPVRRFREWLERTGQLDEYVDRLEAAFNPATLAGLMCRSMVSVSYDGRLYDCDFNQMLDLRVLDAPDALAEFDPVALARRRIATADHCLGCTAGAGSSCGGALA